MRVHSFKTEIYRSMPTEAMHWHIKTLSRLLKLFKLERYQPIQQNMSDLVHLN